MCSTRADCAHLLAAASTADVDSSVSKQKQKAKTCPLLSVIAHNFSVFGHRRSSSFSPSSGPSNDALVLLANLHDEVQPRQAMARRTSCPRWNRTLEPPSNRRCRFCRAQPSAPAAARAARLTSPLRPGASARPPPAAVPLLPPPGRARCSCAAPPHCAQCNGDVPERGALGTRTARMEAAASARALSGCSNPAAAREPLLRTTSRAPAAAARSPGEVRPCGCISQAAYRGLRAVLSCITASGGRSCPRRCPRT